jgi:hypothetical protein
MGFGKREKAGDYFVVALEAGYKDKVGGNKNKRHSAGQEHIYKDPEG